MKLIKKSPVEERFFPFTFNFILHIMCYLKQSLIYKTKHYFTVTQAHISL